MLLLASTASNRLFLLCVPSMHSTSMFGLCDWTHSPNAGLTRFVVRPLQKDFAVPFASIEEAQRPRAPEPRLQSRMPNAPAWGKDTQTVKRPRWTLTRRGCG